MSAEGREGDAETHSPGANRDRPGRDEPGRDGVDGPQPVLGAPGAMVIIISGPSGVGKDTIIRWLRRKRANPERHFVVTYKTRAPRENETDGVDYQFVGVEEFEGLDRTGRLLEASEVHGHWSGTPRDQVAEALVAGRDAILKIDVQGAEKIKRLVPDALRIFVAPPSEDARVARLHRRGTETPEEFERRRRDAAIEMQHVDEYDHVVVNETDRAARTARRIHRIIKQEHEKNPGRRVRL